jgi:hypothetical protein
MCADRTRSMVVPLHAIQAYGVLRSLISTHRARANCQDTLITDDHQAGVGWGHACGSLLHDNNDYGCTRSIQLISRFRQVFKRQQVHSFALLGPHHHT